MKPSEYCREIIQGRLNHNDAPESVQSMIRLHYYTEAVKVLSEKDIYRRRKLLTDAPETYRNELEKEVRRLWPLRSKLSK